MIRRALTALALVAALPALAAELPIPDIPFQKFTLDNGLTLIVHEDHKAPIVAVNVWYHVGSKNEKPGRTGFAPLFEHLMFNGSENAKGDYFKLVEPLGATDLNGTTDNDRTNYFQNVPKSALDTILFLESDRMGHLLGAIDQALLDEQRGVVQNEKRQGDNEPYSLAEELSTKACFPAGHPYSWTVIGSLEDLDAAKLDDVKEWFKTYYGPNNAVLVIAGDVSTSYVTLSALKPNLDRSLALYADLVLNPAFPDTDFKRLQKQQLAAIQREKAQPIGMALRVFPKLLYGAGHPYGLPFSGSGYEEGVTRITRADLVKFHETWFKSANATMVIVGDRGKIEAGIKELRWGDVKYLDADGNPL